jgi:hypothetical protein
VQWGGGASAGAFRMVAEAHGYTMVGIVSGLDLIWLRNDLLQEECYNIPAFEWFFRGEPIGQLHHAAQSSPNVLPQIINFETFIKTGGKVNQSNTAARNILKSINLPCFSSIRQFLWKARGECAQPQCGARIKKSIIVLVRMLFTNWKYYEKRTLAGR